MYEVGLGVDLAALTGLGLLRRNSIPVGVQQPESGNTSFGRSLISIRTGFACGGTSPETEDELGIELALVKPEAQATGLVCAELVLHTQLGFTVRPASVRSSSGGDWDAFRRAGGDHRHAPVHDLLDGVVERDTDETLRNLGDGLFDVTGVAWVVSAKVVLVEMGEMRAKGVLNGRHERRAAGHQHAVDISCRETSRYATLSISRISHRGSV